MVDTNRGSLCAGNWMYDFNTGRLSCASFSLRVRMAVKRWQEGCEYRLATGVQAPRDTGLYELCLLTLDLCCNCCANVSFLKKPRTWNQTKSTLKKQPPNQYRKRKTTNAFKKKKPKNIKIRTAGERMEGYVGTVSPRKLSNCMRQKQLGNASSL